jgi:hypothetical protein
MATFEGKIVQHFYLLILPIELVADWKYFHQFTGTLIFFPKRLV